MLERSIADEVEAAIKAGSTEKHLDTLRQVTDLFLVSADGYSGEQIELFGDVLERLIRTVELRALADVAARIALAEMSTQLASIKQAPRGQWSAASRSNDEISIARPVLTRSARLTAEDLVELAQTKGEQHLLAISGRWWLTEVVTDALLKRHYPFRQLAARHQSRRADVGERLCRRAEAGGEPILIWRSRPAFASTCRPSSASNCCAAPPRSCARGCCRARRRICSRKSGTRSRWPPPAPTAKCRARAISPRPAASSQRLPKHGKLNEPALLAFAKERKYDETVAALAELSGSTIDVIRPVDAEPARRRRADPLPRRRIELGNRRRRARQPLRLGQHGPPRTGEGRKSNTAS